MVIASGLLDHFATSHLYMASTPHIPDQLFCQAEGLVQIGSIDLPISVEESGASNEGEALVSAALRRWEDQRFKQRLFVS
jgi:hypothetical protein